MKRQGDRASSDKSAIPSVPVSPGLPVSATPAPWTTPPTPEHLEQITRARILGAKLKRAVSVAVFSGWSTAVFAMLTLLFGVVSFSAVGSLLGIGMAIVSMYEFRGASQLKRLDPTAPRRLAINQVVFGALLFAYGAISLWQSLSNPSEMMTEITKDPNMREMAGPAMEIAKTVVIAVYAGVMLFAIISPGLTAWYYASRKRYVEEYLKQTPQWIVDLQRAGMTV